jgi:hypothetical protein
MEKLMLKTLGFNLTLPTPYNFLARFLKAAHVHLDKPVSAASRGTRADHSIPFGNTGGMPIPYCQGSAQDGCFHAGSWL